MVLRFTEILESDGTDVPKVSYNTLHSVFKGNSISHKYNLKNI